jgi:glycosyltransferase involved in cell wall biosynthesis
MKKLSYEYVWIINGWEGYGISSITKTLAHLLIKDKKSLLFISISEGSLVESLKEAGFTIQCLNLNSVNLFKESIIYTISELFQNLKKISNIFNELKSCLKYVDYKILIYGSPNLTLFVSLIKSKDITKIYLMPNVIGDGYTFNINKVFYRCAFRYGKINIFANSQYTASTIASKKVRPHILYLGVETNKFDPFNETQERANFNISNKDIVFGIFARFRFTKAQDLIIEAFYQLIEETSLSNLKLLLVGFKSKDAYYQKCLRLVQTYKIEDKVIMLPETKNIVSYFSLVDVIINSRRDAEPFGLTIIEAMLMQKPVIALDLGGPSETIINGETGWLVPTPCKESFLAGMHQSIIMRDQWANMGINGRKHALINFSTETFYNNFQKIVDEIQK